MKQYFYDVEVSPNMFEVTFLDYDTPNEIIEAYLTFDSIHDDINKSQIKAIINAPTFIISEHQNDLDLFLDFMSVHKVIIGFNNSNYDDLILDIILAISKNIDRRSLKEFRTLKHINTIIYEESSEIIAFGKGYYNILRSKYNLKYNDKPYESFDIQKILALDKTFTSLKQTAIQLKWYRIQDLPYNHYDRIPKDALLQVIDYNFNDILITRKLWFNEIKEVNQRIDISNEYGINVRNLSRASTAKKIIAKYYGEATNQNYNDFKNHRTERWWIQFNEIIDNRIQFNGNRLTEFLNKLKSINFHVGVHSFNYPVRYGSAIYTIAKGGIHSKDDPKLFKSTDDFDYIDADAGSFYPNIVNNLKVFPRHLNEEAFLNICNRMTTERMEAKEIANYFKKQKKHNNITNEEILELEKYSTKEGAMKISINAGTFGMLGDKDSFLFDMQALYTVTINGELYILMLVEDLEDAKFSVISANTDGIITKVPKNRKDEYSQIVTTWANYLKYKMEYVKYDIVARYAVNTYLAAKSGFKDSYTLLLSKYNTYWNIPEYELKQLEESYIKEKGDFLTEVQFNKGYYAPIISKTIKAFFLYDISIDVFLKNHTDIYDFCVSQKSSSDFYIVYRTIKNGLIDDLKLQKNNRFFISNKGGVILKKYKNPKPNKKGIIISEISIIAKKYVTIFNNYYSKKDFKDYNIDYNFYFNEIRGYTVDITNNTNTLFQ